jgi:anti-sigma regulatory factor (Ser/Thr protein kinase)
MTLPPEPGSVAEARTRVLDALRPQLGASQLETLRLLVSEVVTNAVRHGGSNGDAVEITARWNSEVRVDVVDRGNGFTPVPRTAALDEPGGFGLFLVGCLADRWGVDSEPSTRVWFTLRRD